MHLIVRIFLILIFTQSIAQAYQDKTYMLGISPASFGLFNKVTTKPSAQGDTFGTNEYFPVMLGSVWSVFGNWYFAPQVVTTLLVPTRTPDGYQRTFTTLLLPFGKNFEFGSSVSSSSTEMRSGMYHPHVYSKPSSSTSEVKSKSTGSNWDWNIAPGIHTQELKGLGGTYTDPFGAVGFQPDTTSTSQEYVLSTGIGYESGNFRFSSNVVFFDFFSSEKRATNLFLAFAWLGDY